MRRFLIVLLGVALAAIALAYYDYRQYLKRPLVGEESPLVFSIERGWPARRIARELESAGIVQKPHWFELYLRVSNKAGQIKSGEFELEPGTTLPQLIDTFVSGKTRQYSAIIIEGSTFRQLRRKISSNRHLEQTLHDRSDAQVMTALGLDGIHPEGQFLADTYRFPRGTSDLDFLARANRSLQRSLERLWEERDDGLPLESPYEALIMASIVEKETAVADERALIAGVFHARLKRGMRLQTDPTVIYGLGVGFDGNIRRRDLITDTPYNTYTRAGLPPTPIAMVGKQALRAVLHPQETAYLYFVSRGDGTHQFSATLEAHNAAVSKYQLRPRNRQ